MNGFSSSCAFEPCDDPRTILYIHHGWGLGGAPLSLLRLAQSLHPEKYQPVILCLQDGEAAHLFRSSGIETHICEDVKPFNHTTAGWYPVYDPYKLVQLAMQPTRFLLSARRTETLIRAYRPALVHLNSLTLAPSALGVWRAGIPLVWHVREAVHSGHFGLRRSLLRRWLHNWPDEIIYICRDNQQRLTGNTTGIVIYNFVDFQRFDRTLSGTQVRERLGIAPDDRVVLHLGGFRPIKGTWELLQAVRQVREQFPNVRCIVAGCAGGGSSFWTEMASFVGFSGYSQRIRDYIQENGLEATVLLQPFRSDVHKLLAAADLLVFPSLSPHFARPVMEAGAMAKPVVASRLGGVAEVVSHEETGLLTPPGDVDALADAIVRVLENPDFASRLGEAGYRQAQRLFDAQENVRRTVEIYDRLLGDAS